ncbi:MAG: DUF47 domain-containing protein [Candidatus Egerieousia sp.]
MIHFYGGGKKFYPLFAEQSKLLVKASELLIKVLREDSYEKKKELTRDMKQVEREGDIIDSKISETLYQTRIVPFKREDIQTLGSRMESFLDLIHDSAKKIVIYHPKATDTSWLEIGEMILQDAKFCEEIADLLSNYKKNAHEIHEKCAKMKDIEQEVDDLYEYYMSHLFEAEKNGIELTKCKNIVQCLEDATDAAKEVADCVKMIILARD